MMTAENMTGSCFSFGGRGERHHHVDEKVDDALLAQELNALTMEERNLLYEEVSFAQRV
jgi:hypothetical protein